MQCALQQMQVELITLRSPNIGVLAGVADSRRPHFSGAVRSLQAVYECDALETCDGLWYTVGQLYCVDLGNVRASLLQTILALSSVLL